MLAGPPLFGRIWNPGGTRGPLWFFAPSPRLSSVRGRTVANFVSFGFRSSWKHVVFAKNGLGNAVVSSPIQPEKKKETPVSASPPSGERLKICETVHPAESSIASSLPTA